MNRPNGPPRAVSGWWTGEVASLEVVDDRLTGVRLRDGVLVDRDVLVVSTRMVAQAAFLADLGLKPTEHPSGLGEHIKSRPHRPHRRARSVGCWQRDRPRRPGWHVCGRGRLG